MAGNLGKFLRSITNNRDYKVISKLGETIRDIPNHQFFTNSPLPATDARSVRKQYRVNPKAADVDSTKTSYMFEDMGMDPMFGPPNPSTSYAEASSIPHMIEAMGGPEFIPIGDLDLWSQLPPNAKAYVMDTLFLSPGSGVGKRMYPAAFDLLSGQKGMYNLSSELTPINEIRKSLNMADAIKRNPDLADRLLPNSSQLSLTPLIPGSYNQMTLTDKIGALQQAAFSKLYHEGLYPDVRDYEHYLQGKTNLSDQLVKSLKESSTLLDVPLDIPLEDLNHVLRKDDLIRGLSRDYGIGPSTVNRMILLGNALEDTKHPQEELLKKGLGFKRGGLTYL